MLMWQHRAYSVGRESLWLIWWPKLAINGLKSSRGITQEPTTTNTWLSTPRHSTLELVQKQDFYGSSNKCPPKSSDRMLPRWWSTRVTFGPATMSPTSRRFSSMLATIRLSRRWEKSGPGRTPPEQESSVESRAVSKILPPTRRSWDTIDSRTTRNPKETPPTRSLQEVTSTLLPPEDQLSSPTMPRQPLYSEFLIKMDVLYMK